MRYMKDIGSRIKEIRNDMQLSQAEFANKYNLGSATNLSRYENGQTQPPLTFLVELSRDAKITTDWLLLGKHPKKIVEALMLNEERTAYELTPEVIIRSPEEYKAKLDKIEPGEPYIPIPLLSDPVAAGDPIDINENDIEGFAVIYQRWLRKGHIYRCVRVKGNSMSPILEDGFIVAIDCSINQPHKLQGKIVAARHLGAVTIKWLLLNDENYILMPQNSNEYKPIVIPITVENVIIGEAAWWWGRQKPRKAPSI